tara:strand:- start:239 stop:928 length:690 start_codon:yes stop_codon:yes gene_type:complete
MNQVNQQENKQYQPEIYLVDSFTQDECWFLIDWFKHNKHLCSVGSSFDYSAITRHTILDNRVRKLFNRMTYDNISFLNKLLDKPLYPEMSLLAEWPIGGQQHPHVDTYSTYEVAEPDEELQGHLDNNTASFVKKDNPNREWTSITYLNTNYNGGETWFPEFSESYYEESYRHKPIQGQSVIFRGVSTLHGVSPVRRNSRYTIAQWYTGKEENILTDLTTEDIHLTQFDL